MNARRVRDERGAVGVMDGLVGALIGSLILAALLGYWFSTQRVSDKQTAQSQDRAEVTRLVDAVVRDVRDAEAIPYADATDLIVQAAATERAPATLIWYAVSDDMLTVRERPAGGDPITGWSGTPVSQVDVVADQTVFELLDARGQVTTEIPNAASVRAQVTLDTASGPVADEATAPLTRLATPLRPVAVPECPSTTGERTGAAVALTWPRVADATEFVVHRDGSPVATLRDTGAATFTWTTPTAPAGTTFEVTARGPAGESDCSLFAAVAP